MQRLTLYVNENYRVVRAKRRMGHGTRRVGVEINSGRTL